MTTLLICLTIFTSGAACAFSFITIQNLRESRHEQAIWDDIRDRARRGEFDGDGR